MTNKKPLSIGDTVATSIGEGLVLATHKEQICLLMEDQLMLMQKEGCVKMYSIPEKMNNLFVENPGGGVMTDLLVNDGIHSVKIVGVISVMAEQHAHSLPQTTLTICGYPTIAAIEDPRDTIKIEPLGEEPYQIPLDGGD